MIFLADSGSGWVSAVIVFGLILVGWISEKMKAKPEPPPAPSQPRQPRTPALPTAAPLSEEERTRRFLEALGVPAPTAAPPRQAPTPLRETPRQAQQQRRGQERPVPPIVPRGTGGTVRTPYSRPVPTSPSLDSLPKPVTPAGQIGAGGLPSLEHPSFQTTSSIISATPSGHFVASSVTSTEAHQEARGRSLRLEVLLRSPESLRTAVLLKEILGAPRCLQSMPGARNLPSP